GGSEGGVGGGGWAFVWGGGGPRVGAVLTVIGLFLAVSWVGLWLWLPPVGRGLGLFVFAVLLAVPIVEALLWLRIPSRQDRLRRLDRISGLAHRPATAGSDEMAAPPGDTRSKALWRAPGQQAPAKGPDLKGGPPGPRRLRPSP